LRREGSRLMPVLAWKATASHVLGQAHVERTQRGRIDET
jgi:hypothetical protein